jgi:hypothetical protein
MLYSLTRLLVGFPRAWGYWRVFTSLSQPRRCMATQIRTVRYQVPSSTWTTNRCWPCHYRY